VHRRATSASAGVVCLAGCVTGDNTCADLGRVLIAPGPGQRPRISLADVPITSRMLGVELDGASRVWPAHVGCPSIQTDRDGCSRIAWMIIGMKCLPTQDRMARRLARHATAEAALSGPPLPAGQPAAGSRRAASRCCADGHRPRADFQTCSTVRERGWGWGLVEIVPGSLGRTNRPGGRHPGDQAGIPRNSLRTARHRRSASTGSVSLLSRPMTLGSGVVSP